MDPIDAEVALAQDERRQMEEALEAGARLDVSAVAFDTDLYGGGGSDPTASPAMTPPSRPPRTTPRKTRPTRRRVA
ncbi:hypothetical protein BAE44_0009208 [Dichanthelium oligosanthes]|uniref:Uncharacterized protein n=1 Tax=Dichanthelium oligosanthes TaxID=888268 RepID=A0A1E5VXD3_9POAL|nr:hypothetical protein BAE44_0009208 [Dichanthelium oligosanthes]